MPYSNSMNYIVDNETTDITSSNSRPMNQVYVFSLFDRFQAEHEAFKARQNTQRSTLENKAIRSKADIRQVESIEFTRILSMHKEALNMIHVKEEANKHLHNLRVFLDQDLAEEYEYVYKKLLPFIRRNLEEPNISKELYIKDRKEKFEKHLTRETSKLFDGYSQDINDILLKITNKFKHESSLKQYMPKLKEQLEYFVKSQILSGVSIIRGLFHEELLAYERCNNTLTTNTTPETNNNENKPALPKLNVDSNADTSQPARFFANVITSAREKLAPNRPNLSL